MQLEIEIEIETFNFCAQKEAKRRRLDVLGLNIKIKKPFFFFVSLGFNENVAGEDDTILFIYCTTKCAPTYTKLANCRRWTVIMMVIICLTVNRYATSAGVLAVWCYNDLLFPRCTVSPHLKPMCLSTASWAVYYSAASNINSRNIFRIGTVLLPGSHKT